MSMLKLVEGADIEDVWDDDKNWDTKGRLDETDTGIPNLIITMIAGGPDPVFSQIVMHISNTPNEFSFDDYFLITIPDMRIIGPMNIELIDNKTLDDIFEWIILNMKTIIAHGTNEIGDTLTYIEMLKKLKL